MVRLASEEYNLDNNTENMYVHLTNYSLNKKNENYDGVKYKLKLSDLLKTGLSSSSNKGYYSKTR